MDRQEDLLALEIELLQAAGRRYGLMLDRLRREKRDRVRMEARRAIETAMRKHGPVRPGGGGQGQGDLLRAAGGQHHGPGAEGDR